MLIRNEIENAVRLQACGYQLLKWLEKALTDGFIGPEAAGTYATSEEAAYSWLDKHYLNLPDKARPKRSDLRAFSNFFTTYLTSTFDLDAEPGELRAQPQDHETKRDRARETGDSVVHLALSPAPRAQRLVEL
jgi:hypothetical protein